MKAWQLEGQFDGLTRPGRFVRLSGTTQGSQELSDR
jgi:hypothetical protein